MSKIGLIAGGGKFPVVFAREAAHGGNEVYCAALKDVADKELESICAEVRYFKLGQLSAPIEFFKERGVGRAAMSGLIKHASVFSVMPDLRGVRLLAGLKDKRAETILRAVADEFASEGVELVNSAMFLDRLMAGSGVLCGKKPSDKALADVRLGWKTAKTLAALDVGLTAAVYDRAVIALEGMEGTDACIVRAGELCRQAREAAGGALTVVKVARARQDMRFDLPVIGKGTIRSMLGAGAALLAVEAGKTLMLEKEEVLAFAGENGITVAGFTDADFQM